MNPPPPPAAAAAAAGGTGDGGRRENLQQQQGLSRLHRPPRAVGGGGGRDAVASAGAGDAGFGDGRWQGGGKGAVVEDQLWPDKHRPRDVSGLAVHTKKVCVFPCLKCVRAHLRLIFMNRCTY